MKIINTTPQDYFEVESGVTFKSDPSQIAEVEVTMTPLFDLSDGSISASLLPDGTFASDVIPVFSRTFGEVRNEPKEVEDVRYIVSIPVQQARPYRTDFLLGGTEVRDSEGKITGFKGFTVSPYMPVHPLLNPQNEKKELELAIPTFSAQLTPEKFALTKKWKHAPTISALSPPRKTITYKNIVNTTPHLITELLTGQYFHPDAEKLIRVKTIIEFFYDIQHSWKDVDFDPPIKSSVSKKVFGALENEPPYEEGVYYIVSMLVQQAAPHRKDFLCVGEQVRGEKGVILGCKGFVAVGM